MTTNQRSAAINLSAPWRQQLPRPDSLIDRLDRYHLAYLYPATSLITKGGCFAAGMVYLPGFKEGDEYLPGFKEGDTVC